MIITGADQQRSDRAGGSRNLNDSEVKPQPIPYSASHPPNVLGANPCWRTHAFGQWRLAGADSFIER
jgi:hypothetical protein